MLVPINDAGVYEREVNVPQNIKCNRYAGLPENISLQKFMNMLWKKYQNEKYTLRFLLVL